MVVRFFVDGSSKGLALGAGVVEVDQFGFMTTHEYAALHPNASSNLAELFAVNFAISKALEASAFKVYIYVDTFRIENLLKHSFENGFISFPNEIPSDEGNNYTALAEYVREKVKLFYAQKGKNSFLSIQKFLNEETEDVIVYSNTAHMLSRNYFKKYDSIYVDDNTPLKKHGKEAKLQLNHSTKKGDMLDELTEISNKTVDIKISRDDDLWYSFLGDKEQHYVKSRHLVNIFYHSYKNICRELGVEDIDFNISSTINLVANVESSVNYPRCPEDIRKKGEWVLKMFDEGRFNIVE